MNTDGSAVTNPGRLGASGIFGDKQGKVVMAFETQLGEGTNNKDEIEAANFGLTVALELGCSNILFELDSQVVVQWVVKKKVPQ